ncbi:lamin tail domain-containing protein [Halobaculum sp. MBLA0143]|uniref:lamin tail domain-containing protein n=1 Tax=Halobaculum sp. MBLA0143 TaxID=3079933 RepID=UPI003523626D
MRSSLALAVVVLVVLAGCGGGGTAVDTPKTTGTAGAADATTTGASGVADASTAATNGTLEVHFLNVGQSVATLLVGPTGETMLIDTGHYDDDGEHVLSYLRAHGVDRIDHLVVSHNDADHIGGNAAVIDYYETDADGVGAVYDPGVPASTRTYESYLDAVERHGVTLYETRAGDRIPFEGVGVDVLGPPEPYLEREARNENSVVLKLTYGATSFLFTGDAEDDQETQLVSRYGDRLNATVLKAGHHGSRSSTSAALVDAVDPRAVVISSAFDSRYGHPHEETLARLGSLRTFWTATHGDVVFVSDGERVTVATQAAAPTDPERLRAADPVSVGSDDPVQSRVTIRGTGTVTTAPATTARDAETAGETTPVGDSPADDATADDPRTAVADGGHPLVVETVHADAAGDDRTNLNDEYVTLRNVGDAPVELSGYTVADAAGHTHTFADGVVVDPGATLTLHTGAGDATASDRYWDASAPVWNNDGDTVTLTAPDGTVVLEERYG